MINEDPMLQEQPVKMDWERGVKVIRRQNGFTVEDLSEGWVTIFEDGQDKDYENYCERSCQKEAIAKVCQSLLDYFTVGYSKHDKKNIEIKVIKNRGYGQQ